jgi:hypothetical protein
MIRKVIINNIVGGNDKETIESILPELAGSFKQRKQFFEYYFESTMVDFSLENLDELSNQFKVVLFWDELEIVL